MKLTNILFAVAIASALTAGVVLLWSGIYFLLGLIFDSTTAAVITFCLAAIGGAAAAYAASC